MHLTCQEGQEGLPGKTWLNSSQPLLDRKAQPRPSARQGQRPRPPWPTSPSSKSSKSILTLTPTDHARGASRKGRITLNSFLLAPFDDSLTSQPTTLFTLKTYTPLTPSSKPTMSSKLKRNFNPCRRRRPSYWLRFKT
jgi:hypothetical protein